MRVLVLGGTRFIGAAAVRVLHAGGHQVTCFHRGRNEAQLPASVQHVYGERLDLEEFRQRFSSPGFDVLLDMRPLNADDARAVMALADGTAQRVVAVSSMDVYRSFGVLVGKDTWPEGGTRTAVEDEDALLRASRHPHALDEPRAADDPMKWADDYDKIPAEEVFLGSRVPGTVLRLPMVYGPSDYHRRVGAYVHRMTGRKALVLGEEHAGWRTTRGYIDDVGAGIALAVSDGLAAGKVYNVGEQTYLTELEWVQAIAEACGWPGRVVVVGESELPESLRAGINAAQHLRLDSSRIRRDLGYLEGLTQTEAIARSVAWELAHPPLDLPDRSEEDALLGRLGA
jgi:nucleoside-diphosphate-sugar epimerase